MWLWNSLRGSLRWLSSNPVLIFLVFAVVLYNSFTNEAPRSSVNLLSAASIFSALKSVAVGLLTPVGVGLALLAILSASAITMLSVGTTFAVFRHQPRPLLDGARAVLSGRTFEYAFIQITVLAALGGAFFVTTQTVVTLPWIDDTAAAVFLVVLFCAGYPIMYMILSTTALLLGAEGRFSKKLGTGLVFIKRRNLIKLTLFYLVRIGSEMAALAGLAIIASRLGLPPLVGLLLGVAAATLPLALVRTAGFLIKLGMLRDAPWFRSAFSAYYANN